MSMSTRLEDLPDSIEEDTVPQELSQSHPNLKIEEQESNVKVNIKKRVRFADEEESKGFLESLKSEVNEENVLILILLITSSFPLLDEYVNKIPFLNKWTNSNSLLMSIFKGVVLLIIFILLKIYLLPYLKV